MKEEKKWNGRIRHNLNDLPPLPQEPVSSRGVFAAETNELFDLTIREIDYSQNLLGNRWIGRGQTGLIIGPSGIGKTTAVMQMIAAWCVGRETFGIQPSKPLAIALVQAEDETNDLIYISQGVARGLEITLPERKIGSRNNILVTAHNHNGEEFVFELDKWLTHVQKVREEEQTDPIDLIIINPVFSYLGAGEANDTLPVRQLLRHGLLPLACKHRVGFLIVHHTPKTTNRDTSKYGAHDWMYSGHGSAEFTNTARAVLCIEPTEDANVFQFIAAKRGAYVGWPKDSTGKYSRYFKHSSDGSLFWRAAEADDIAAALEPAGCREEDVLTVIKKSATPLIQKEIEVELHAEGLKNVKKVLPKLLRDMLAKGLLFVHPRRGTSNQVLDAYSTVRCTEDVPDLILKMVPAEGIGRKELLLMAKTRFTPSEIERALHDLMQEGKIRQETKAKNKLFLFRT